MLKAPFDQLVEKITKSSGLEKEEVLRRIEAKKAKLSGLISNEGAAQIVAAELGISFEKQKMKIHDLMIGMKKVSIIGKIIDDPSIKKFRKQEREGELCSFAIADETSNIRIVLWDTKHIEMIKNGTLKKDSVIDIKNADVRGTTNREVHLSSFSELAQSTETIESTVLTKDTPIIKKISEVKTNERSNIRANVLQFFNISFFYVCPECGLKVTLEGDKATCVRHGSVLPKKRAILNVLVDDGSENLRATAFNEAIFKLLGIEEDMSKLEDPSFMLEKKQEIVGSEFLFLGKTRKNVLFNRDEFIINDCERVDPDMVIKQYA